MFSGIVEETGIVEKIVKKENLSTLYIRGKKVVRGTKVGDSISVSGVCLTVTGVNNGLLCFDIMKETIIKTSLGKLCTKSKVNLERALKMNSRISGHFVSGHVDNMETVKDVITGPNYTEIQVTVSKELSKYIVPKGSVTLDGVSLTVGDVRKKFFSVYLIPFTLEVTTLGINKKGDKINIETDILAKYVLAGSKDSRSPYVYSEA
ncbi:MAG: riboflavin synthase [Candidatus Omnitrophica bacterium]|nr:riboflavin synthase [Candidatus Omnitrophota bacterium]